jgi:hypothetical protein
MNAAWLLLCTLADRFWIPGQARNDGYAQFWLLGVTTTGLIYTPIEGIDVHIPTIDDLIINKRSSGRTKDFADAEALEFLKNAEHR